MSDKLKVSIFAALDSPVMTAGTQVLQREGWYQIINPALKEASSNEVMLSLLEESEVDRRVDETFALYRKHSLPFKWAIGPMSSPGKLEEMIAPRASASWEFCGMVIDTDREIAETDQIQIEKACTDNFSDFLQVNLNGWDLGKFKTQTEDKLRRMVSHPGCRCFLAKKDGKPVGTAATILKDGYGYFVGAVVLKEFRGLGAYRALTRSRLLDLQTTGIPFAVTQARTATSAPILEKLGFEQTYQARIYRFDPA